MNEIQKSYLLETAKWQKLLGILMGICAVLLAGLGIAFFFIGNRTEPSEAFISGIGAGGGITYLLCAVLYFFFASYLLRSAKNLKAWGASDAEEDLTEALKNNKSFFKLSGIMSIISVVIIALALVVFVLAGTVFA